MDICIYCKTAGTFLGLMNKSITVLISQEGGKGMESGKTI